MAPAPKLQICIAGSAADQHYGPELEALASEVGRLVGESGNILVFGANVDTDTLGTVAARAARRAGGLAVGITYGTDKNIVFREDSTDVLVATGSERGGGREFVLIHSCDAVIMIAGGAGTLTEAAIAYQEYVPIVALAGSGGWADKLAGTFFDARERVPVLSARTPEEAVEIALREGAKPKIRVV